MTGRQVRINKRSIDAKLPRKVLVGDLNEFFMTVRIMRTLPTMPMIKVILMANIRSVPVNTEARLTHKPQEVVTTPAK